MNLYTKSKIFLNWNIVYFENISLSQFIPPKTVFTALKIKFTTNRLIFRQSSYNNCIFLLLFQRIVTSKIKKWIPPPKKNVKFKRIIFFFSFFTLLQCQKKKSSHLNRNLNVWMLCFVLYCLKWKRRMGFSITHSFNWGAA